MLGVFGKFLGVFLECFRGGGMTTSHDVVWDAFVFIMKDVRFYVYGINPTFFHYQFLSLCQRVDIMVLVNDVWMSLYIIQLDLVSHIVLFHGVAIIIAT